MKPIRIFISSPGDVSEERDRAREVIKSLQRRYVHQLYLKPIFWEDLPLPPDLSFQEGIDVVLSEQGVDVAVFILWSRLGSPTGPRVVRADGTEYRSGTERELDLMLKARERTKSAGDTIRPELLVYTRADDASFEERLRSTTTEKKRHLIEQKTLVESFIREEFRESEGGQNKRAYHSFDLPQTFAQRLRAHLSEILDRIAGINEDTVAWKTDEKGTPYPGLSPYAREHAPVFFGREDEVNLARHNLGEAARSGCAFLLISGSSGSGKSSLARAGLIPDIIECEVDDHVSNWVCAAVKPGEIAPDFLDGLAAAITASVPEIAGSLEDTARFVSAFKENPKIAFDLMLRGVLHAKSGRLVLLIDQLEELFTHGTETQIAAIGKALDFLARSGLVWVIATVRSDFSHRLNDTPSFAMLRRDGKEIGLAIPSPDAVARIIRDPARLSGLTFEKRDGKTLDEVLLNEIADHRELLPFLAHVLRELYEHRDTRSGLLTFHTWETQLGGDLETALARYADAVLAALPSSSQTALPRAWAQLVSVGGDKASRAVRLYPQLANLKPKEDPELAALTTAFIEARLFTSTGNTSDARVSVIHESLLRVWDKATEWFSKNIDELRKKRNVVSFQQRWESSPGRDTSLLLPRGLPLEEGRSLEASALNILSDETLGYIHKSIAHQEAEERRKKNVRRVVATVLAGLAITAVIAAVVAFRRGSETAIALAESERLQLERTTSLAGFYHEKTVSGNGGEAYAAEALSLAPENLAFRRYAYGSLSLEQTAVPRFFSPADAMLLQPPLVTANGSHVLLSPIGGATRFFDVAKNHISEGIRPDLGVAAYALGKVSEQTILSDMRGLRLYPKLPEEIQKPTSIRSLPSLLLPTFAGNDQYAVAGLSEAMADVYESMGGGEIMLNTLGIWELPDGELTDLELISFPIHSIETSATRPLAAAIGRNGEMALIDLRKKEVIHEWAPESDIESALFSPEGDRILFSGAGDTLHLWKTEPPVEGWKPIGFKHPITAMAFAPAGKSFAIATGSSQGWVRCYRSATGTSSSKWVNHGEQIKDITFVGDSKTLASISEEGSVQLWEADAGILLWKGRHGTNGGHIFATEGGQSITTVTERGSLAVWEKARLVTAPPVALPHRKAVSRLAIGKEENVLASASYGKTDERTVHQVWSLETLLPLSPPIDHSETGGKGKIEEIRVADSLISIAFDSGMVEWWTFDGKFSCSAGLPAGTVSDTDINNQNVDFEFTMAMPRPLGEHGTAAISSIAANEDDVASFTELLSGGAGARELQDKLLGVLRIFTPEVSTEVVEIFHRGGLLLPFSIDLRKGRIAALNGADTSVLVWERVGESWEKTFIENLPKKGSMVGHAALSSDAESLCLVTLENTLHVYDVGSSKERWSIEGEAKISDIFLSLDGRHIVIQEDISDEASQLRVFNLSNGSPLGLRLHHSENVSKIAFSPDGQTLLAGDYGGEAKLWDIRSGLLASPVIKLPGDDINDVAFSPDGALFFTATDDAGIQVWNHSPVKTPAPEWVPELLRDLSGTELTPQGQEVKRPPATLDSRASLLADATEESEGADWEALRQQIALAGKPEAATLATHPLTIAQNLHREASLWRDLGEGTRALHLLRIANWLGAPSADDPWSDFFNNPEALVHTVETNSLPAGKRLDSSFGTAFRWCPPGRFRLCQLSPEAPEFSYATPHNVVLTEGFWMAETEVPQALWEEITGSSVRNMAETALRDETTFKRGSKDVSQLEYTGLKSAEEALTMDGFFAPEKPAIFVSWNDIEEFFKILNDEIALPHGAPEDWVYRLPTESEWEYANRSGGIDTAHNGAVTTLGKSNSPELDRVACYSGNCSLNFQGGGYSRKNWKECSVEGDFGGIAPCGSFEANSWGLRDMLGNVSEWCLDSYDREFGGDYVKDWAVNPFYTEENRTIKIARGGNWKSTVIGCRPERRVSYHKNWRNFDLGFRIVIGPPKL